MREPGSPSKGTARLTLRINGELYDVRPPLHSVIRLRKTDGTEYRITHRATGDECSCPDFATRQRPGGCKHIKALAIWHL